MLGFAAAADVLFPLIPSETIVITASVLAAQGDLLIWLIVPAVAIGAFIGDNLCYWLGRRIGDPIADRPFDGEKGQARLKWAEEALRRLLIVISRLLSTTERFASIGSPEKGGGPILSHMLEGTLEVQGR